MVETANRQLDQQKVTVAAASISEIKDAIVATRARLAVRMADTRARVNVIFTEPTAARTEPRVGRAVGAAIRTIAAAGRITRAWRAARRTGLFRTTAMAAGIGVALALAVTKYRRGRT